MVLHKLHVGQRRAGPVGQRHAIARADHRVGGEGEDAARAARGQDHRLRRQRAHLTGQRVNGRQPDTAAILHQQGGDELLVVPDRCRCI